MSARESLALALQEIEAQAAAAVEEAELAERSLHSLQAQLEQMRRVAAEKRKAAMQSQYSVTSAKVSACTSCLSAWLLLLFIVLVSHSQPSDLSRSLHCLLRPRVPLTLPHPSAALSSPQKGGALTST